MKGSAPLFPYGQVAALSFFLPYNKAAGTVWFLHFRLHGHCIEKKLESLEERKTIYIVLYEFMEELTELYEKACKQLRKEKNVLKECRENYIMTICGILNPVMESCVDDAEGFCNYVFNHIVSDKEFIQHNIDSFPLFQTL